MRVHGECEIERRMQGCDQHLSVSIVVASICLFCVVGSHLLSVFVLPWVGPLICLFVGCYFCNLVIGLFSFVRVLVSSFVRLGFCLFCVFCLLLRLFGMVFVRCFWALV